MGNAEFDSEKVSKYWSDSSDEEFYTMNAMYESKRYNWSMFVGHG